MSEAERPTTPPKKRKWLRRTVKSLLALVGIALFAVILFKTLPFWGKPIFERQITALTGLPADIGSLSVTLTPTPKIFLSDINLGDAAVRVRISECLIRTNPLEPIMQKSTVALVELLGVEVWLPEDVDEIGTAIAEIMANFSGDDGGKSAQKASQTSAPRAETPTFDVHVDLDNLQVYKGDTLALDGFLSLVNLRSATMQASWYIDIPLFRPATQFNGTIRMSDGGAGVAGNINLTDFHVNDLLKLIDRTAPLVPDLPDVVINAAALLEGDPTEQMAVSLKGSLTATDNPVIAGDFSGVLWHDPEKLVLNDFKWASPGMSLAADGNYYYDGHFALQVPQAQVDGDPLNILLALAPTGVIRLSGGKNAQVSLADILVGLDESGNFRFSKGGVNFKHILAIPEGAKTGLGDFEGAVSIAENTVNIERVVGQGFRAAGTVHTDLDTQSAVLNVAADLDLARLLSVASGADIPLQNPTGTIQLKQLTAAWSMQDGLRDDFAMQVALDNVGGVYNPGDGAPPISLKNVTGAMHYQNGVLDIAEIKGSGLKLTGKVWPNFEKNQARVDMKGEMDLASGLLRLFMPAAVTGMSGALAIEQLSGTFASGAGLPPDLNLAAALSNGAVQLKSEGFEESLKNISSQFKTDGKKVNVTASAQGLRVGEVSLSGNHDLDNGRFAGKVRCSPNTLVQPYLTGQPYPVLLASLLNAYSPASLDVQLELPTDSRSHLSLTLARVESPALHLKATLLPEAGGYRPGEVVLQTECPLDRVDFRELPYPVTASSTAVVNFEHQPTTRAYTASIDLTNAALSVAPHFKKSPGDSMRILAAGSSAPEWSLGDLELFLLGEQVRLAWTAQGLVAEQFSLNLANTARCFPDAQAMSGQIQGTLRTNPLDIDLTLRDVRAQLGTPLPVSQANGVLRYNNDRIECQNLRVIGANNDFTANAVLREGKVQGDIHGDSFDIDSFLALYNSFAGEAPPVVEKAETGVDVAVGAAAPPAAGTTPTQGNVNVDIRQVRYLGELFRQVRASVALSEKEVRVDNLYVVPQAGSVSGSVKIGYPTTPARRYIETDLTLNDADMRVIDKWYYQEPRGVHGAASGTIRMTIPYDENGVVFNGLNGNVNLLMQNGSFGKMGFATKLTTALRSTEFIQLRAPQIRDKGLTFDASTLKLTATNGVISIDPFDMTSPSYEIKATGTINYPDDSTNITAYFNALERVSGIAQNIPVLGEAISTIRGVTDLTIYITGSPNDPKYRYGSRVVEGPPPSNPESGERKPGERIRERATGILDRIGL